MELSQIEHPSVKSQDNWSSAHSSSKPTTNLTHALSSLVPTSCPGAGYIKGSKGLPSHLLSVASPFLLSLNSPHNSSSYMEKRDLQDLNLFLYH